MKRRRENDLIIVIDSTLALLALLFCLLRFTISASFGKDNLTNTGVYTTL